MAMKFNLNHLNPSGNGPFSNVEPFVSSLLSYFFFIHYIKHNIYRYGWFYYAHTRTHHIDTYFSKIPENDLQQWPFSITYSYIYYIIMWKKSDDYNCF